MDRWHHRVIALRSSMAFKRVLIANRGEFVDIRGFRVIEYATFCIKQKYRN